MEETIYWSSMIAIIKKEFMDNVRNKWILAMTIVFIILALVMSYFGSAASGETGFQGFALTTVLILGISTILIPIISLMLGYGAIVGEKERGSMDLLLSMPISRSTIFISKFLGLALVLFLSIFLGFGFAGIVIAAVAGASSWGQYLLFLLATFFLGLVFLSLALLLSSLTKRRSTAMGGAVLLWFWFLLIYDIIIFGVLVAVEGLPTPSPTGGITLPGWFYAFELVNPSATYGFLSQLIISTIPGSGDASLPGFVNGFSTVGALLLWLFIPAILALWAFNKKDVQP
jgi:Cu-processing system permease protein